ncbi:MAG: SMP-30/gluconolactonase/LRE family protein [Chitinophagaceae bacterium]
MKYIILFCCIAGLACRQPAPTTYPTIGGLEALTPEFYQIIDSGALPEILADGFDWTEGPLWIPATQTVLFSDLPPNRIYQWQEGTGVKVYLEPSGYTGTKPRGGEPGSNGLLMDKEGKLVLCQHGDRRIAVMDAPLEKPAPKFLTIADNWEGKRLSSPNDAVFSSDGSLFFTDPPYGLEKNMDDTAKEISFQGVYQWKEGKVKLLVDSITRPNGISLLDGEKTFLVANSDPERAVWYLFDREEGDRLTNPRLLFDAMPWVNKENKGLPDGLKVARQGTIFATGPGGVWVFSSEKKFVGRIKIPEACSNVALSDDEKVLYITADRYLLRLRMKK